MKKKTIEKVPYLKLPKVNRGKMVEYVAVTDIKEIRQEPHLFVEVYRNKKECKEIPVVRIVLTKKDFGTYFVDSGIWSRENITKGTWKNSGLIWRDDDKKKYKTWGEMEKENVLYSPEDMDRIRAFVDDCIMWDGARWWDYIERRQSKLTREEAHKKGERRWKRRRQALKERGEQTSELPEQKILEYADNVLFHKKHYLYYKKHGARATVACSKCGGVADARWKEGISYESQFEKMIEEPGQGLYGTCPMCNACGTYIPQGRAKSFCRATGHLFLGQKYKEDGMVLRYIEVEKEWGLDLICGEKELEMHGSFEKLSGIEIARVYFEQGKKVQKDYQKHNPYSGEDFWDDCNLSGMQNITIREAHIMPETYKNMEGTFLQYSALREYQTAAGDINPADYLERYTQIPQIEMLVKMGLIKVVGQLVKCYCGIVKDIHAKRADLFLGIRKERVKQLIRHQGSNDILKIMQLEKRLGQNWTDEQVEQLTELNIDQEIDKVLEYMGIQKLLNHVAKYAGCEYGTMCSTASGRLRQTAQTYIDYLTMSKDLGYDLENTVNLFPKDLDKAHDKMVMEHNQKEADKRIREMNEKYPLIKKHYRRLRKRLYFEDEEFLIRPARDAGEIVIEGRFLHHCVGGDLYLKRHNKDKSTILLLRHKKEPNMPYITVEIDTKNLNILQWHGAHNRQPDPDRMQRWLNAYITRLKCTGTAADRTGSKEEGQRLLEYA